MGDVAGLFVGAEVFGADADGIHVLGAEVGDDRGAVFDADRVGGAGAEGGVADMCLVAWPAKIPASDEVRPQYIHAVDVVPNFLEHIRGKVEKAGLTQVRLVQASDRSSELAPGSVDAIFLSDAYHHLEYPQHTLASLRAALRPGGTLWLIDFIREDSSDEWLRRHVRAGKAVVLQELAAAGFVLVEELPLLRENYFLKLKVAANAN